MKTLVANPESPEWWHDLMTKPWNFTINHYELPVRHGTEFKSGRVVVDGKHVEVYANKADLVDEYPEEDGYKIEWATE